MCHIQEIGVSIATGLIISQKFVLTTADNLYIKKVARKIDNAFKDRELINIMLLRIYFKRLHPAIPLLRKVLEIHVNKDYVPRSHVHDIAILKVSYYIKNIIILSYYFNKPYINQLVLFYYPNNKP